MKIQSNEILRLEWLLPLLDQQLAQVLDGWQHSSVAVDTMSANYQQVASTLVMANLPRLSHLASKLSQLAAVAEHTSLIARLKSLGYFAHQLLRNELNYYVKNGYYHRTVIDSTVNEISQTLLSIGQLEAARLAVPDSAEVNYASNTHYINKSLINQSATDVLRYDDSGEVVASGQLQTTATESNTESDTEQATVHKAPVEDTSRHSFMAQATEITSNLQSFFPIWAKEPEDTTALTEVRRNFYTLQQSAQSVDADNISHLAGQLAERLAQVLAGTVTISDDLMMSARQLIQQLPSLITDFLASQTSPVDGTNLIQQSDNLILELPIATSINNDQVDGFDDIKATLEVCSHYKHQPLESDSSDKQALTATTPHSVNIPDSQAQMPTELLYFIEQVAPMPADTNVIDPDIKEIFIEEAKEVLAEIQPLFTLWRQDPSELKKLVDIRRGFHTLKGSGRLVGANFSAELAGSIEHLLNQLLAQSISVSRDVEQLIMDVLSYYPQLLTTFAENREDYPADALLWVACANAYSQSKAQDFSYCAWGKQRLIARAQLVSDMDIITVNEQTDSHANASLQTIYSVNEIMAEAVVVVTPQSKEEQAFYQVFSEEAHSLLQQITDFVQANEQQSQVEVSDQIVRAFHTLRAASGSSALLAISEVSATIEQSLEQLQQCDIPMTSQHLQALTQSVALITSYLSRYDKNIQQQANTVSDDPQGYQDLASLQAMLDDYEEEALVNDRLLNITHLLDGDIDALLDAEWQLDAALTTQSEPTANALSTTDDLQRIHSYISQMRQQIVQLTAKTGQSPKFTILLAALDNAYAYLDNQPMRATDAQVRNALLNGHAQLVGLFDALAGSMSLKIDTQVVESLYAISRQVGQATREQPAEVNLIVPKSQRSIEPLVVNNKDRQGLDTLKHATSIKQLIADSWPNGQPDPDILEVYLEEADELVSSSNNYLQQFLLQQFLTDDQDTEALQSLQRNLHTVKGGARMVAANGIADLAHEMETVYEKLVKQHRPITKMLSELLTACYDWIIDAIFILRQRVNPYRPTALIEALKQFSADPEGLKQIPNHSLQAQRDAIIAAKAERKPQQSATNIDQMPAMTGSFAEQGDKNSSTEMISISSSSVEQMINLSGESAINRARIEMGMTSLTTSIEEMGTTVQRLADQLRRMEGELEVQILAQIDEELLDNKDFDPLELDQYSSLNQLSKSLSESASDLVDINSTLLEKTRDSESLLLQLSRTQTELQDGLMKSQIVPFTRLTPRLERIVRQTANELNKSVELTIINADDEMDRNILERITSPLEHMLRNAVDHGIEDTQTRLQAGKERNGHITLEVLREGSEVIIHLIDDGCGIDVEAVRKKAIVKGLIDSNDDTLSNLDVMQYIFNAGLSTTDKLTQISGRGVGMDVVISEIRQLGGIVSVSSEPGQGSQFTMRIPLSVAICDALVVRVADHYYAIPLVQIERIVRVKPEQLYDYYQSGAAKLAIEDRDYRIRYLNEILCGNKFNELLVTTNTSLPLIIIKSRTGQNLALQVDQIAGSRIEIVVKPLGRQLSPIAGISAATIMGDGSVMFILDLIALMRNAPSQPVINPVLTTDQLSMTVQPTILVVDDSVTVRKVTSRFLERQGIKVLIAKDGIEAIETLQQTTPDLILLDIEMPRMDGFEVATQIKHSKHLQHIPIIMITSRTGEKHRQRAFKIGVDDYIGKPFQEKQLLKKIKSLLAHKVSLD
ncbi:Hpt domain-containing protein [Psychrobacter urativorans]|uniref:Hpt domain-containing protein n=1 Tax=Psychrobacter urativorans TaxID=45610 RepID=UPI003BB537FE